MIFNGTLLVQIANFVITCWFLNTFLLKKGYSVVTEKENELADIRARIDECKHNAQQLIQKKEAAHKVYKNTVLRDVPSQQLEAPVFMHIKENVHEIVCDKKKIVTELTPVLEKLLLRFNTTRGDI